MADILRWLEHGVDYATARIWSRAAYTTKSGDESAALIAAALTAAEARAYERAAQEAETESNSHLPSAFSRSSHLRPRRLVGREDMRQFWLDTAKLSDGELADLIHELQNELGGRCRKIATGNWLRDQIEASQLTVRSWSTAKQQTMKGFLQ